MYFLALLTMLRNLFFGVFDLTLISLIVLFLDLSKFLYLAENYYRTAEKNFANNERFLTSGLDLFSYLLKFNEVQYLNHEKTNSGFLSR